MVYRTILFLSCLSLISSGCATKQVRIGAGHVQAGYSEILVRQPEYTAGGMPVFLNRLGKRPGRAGDRFTLVQLKHGQPTKSHDIVVVGPEYDFTRPLKAIYEWTGRGFVGGAQISGFMTYSVLQAGPVTGEEAVAILAFAVAPVVIGAASGFVVGVADGIRTTAEEMGKIVAGKQEQIVAYTTYEYDDRRRLALTRMYKADTRQVLVQTEYLYDGDASEPRKTTIITFPDGAVRVIE